ncbi:MAG: hypothetical protein ACQES2_04270 [Pseudomonadota bacterium]
MFKMRMMTLSAWLFLLAGCAVDEKAVGEGSCDSQTLGTIEQQIPTGDGRGHGPDVGSDEWYSVVEFRLGVRGSSGVPERGTQAWCDFVLSQTD